MDHKHKMAKTVIEKVRLYDYEWNAKLQEWNYLISGLDKLTYKQCNCGFKQPIKVERHVN